LEIYNPQLAELLKSLIKSGKLRAGPDSQEIFYGANNGDVVLIATNQNSDLASTLIHELSALDGKSHLLNGIAEYKFRLWQFKKEFRLKTDVFIDSLKEFIPNWIKKELFAAIFYAFTSILPIPIASPALAKEPTVVRKKIEYPHRSLKEVLAEVFPGQKPAEDIVVDLPGGGRKYNSAVIKTNKEDPSEDKKIQTQASYSFKITEKPGTDVNKQSIAGAKRYLQESLKTIGDYTSQIKQIVLALISTSPVPVIRKEILRFPIPQDMTKSAMKIPAIAVSDKPDNLATVVVAEDIVSSLTPTLSKQLEPVIANKEERGKPEAISLQHTVKKGEYLFKIWRNYRSQYRHKGEVFYPWAEFKQVILDNNKLIKDIEQIINPGQILTIPVSGQASAERKLYKQEPLQEVPGIYIVKDGDSLFKIWKNNYKTTYSWQDFLNIVKKNNSSITDADTIYPKQKLTISLSAVELPASKEAPKDKKVRGTTIPFKPKDTPIIKQEEHDATATVKDVVLGLVQDRSRPSSNDKLLQTLKDKGIVYEGDHAEYLRKMASGDKWKEIQKILYVLEKEKTRFIVGSAERDNTHEILRRFDSLKDFIEFITDAQTEVDIYRVPYNEKEAVDFSQVKTWEEITNILEIKKYEEQKRHFVVFVKGKEDKGLFKGILWSGVEAQKDYLELIRSGIKDREVSAEILRVLDIEDLAAQRKAIKELKSGELEQVFSDAVISEDNNYLYVGVVVERDEWGNISKVARFLQAGEVGVQRVEKPSPHIDLYVKGEQEEKISLKYWPWKPHQVLKVFSVKLPQEIDRENDPKIGPAVVDRYFKSDKDPFLRGEIIFGNNFNKIEEFKLALMSFLEDREREALIEHKKYLKRRIVLEAILVPANIAAGFLTSPASFFVSGGAVASRLIFDLIARPDKKVPGAPKQEEREDFFARFLYIKHLEQIHGRSYFNDIDKDYLDAELAKATEQELEPYRERAGKMIKGLFTREDAVKMDSFIKRRKTEATALFILNLTSLVMRLGAVGAEYVDYQRWIAGEGKAFSNWDVFLDVLNGRYFSLTGEINIPQVISLIAQGKGLPTMSLSDFSSNQAIVEKFFSVVGVTVDAKSVANALYGAFVPPEEAYDIIFATASPSVRINLYLLGFPISLFFDRALVKNIINIVDDKDAWAYEVTHGLFKSKAIAYNETEFFMKPKLPGVTRIPVGEISIANTKLNLPVYLFVDVKPNGEKEYRIFILTQRSLGYYKGLIEKDMKNYRNYAENLEKGGYERYVSPLAGTYYQNLASGLFEGHNRQGHIYFPSSYTWDMVLITQRALLSDDFTLVRSTLDFYEKYFKAVTKNGSDFNGFSASHHAYLGEPAGAQDVASTASLGYMMMAYEARTNDTRYRYMLEPTAKWLLAMQKNYGGGGLRQIPKTREQKDYPGPMKGAEPNAIAYAFLSEYGRKYDNPWFGKSKYLKSADKILAWVKEELWDEQRGLIRFGEGEAGFSADAQTRWILVLGPEQFMKEFEMAPEEFFGYLKRIKETFSVTFDYDS